MTQDLESWHSAAYAGEWAGDDVLADLLELPRRISIALVRDARIEARHVLDLGSGPGAYLDRFLRAFPSARGTWVDSSEAMLEIAQENLSPFDGRVRYLVADLERLAELDLDPADVAVTSRVLHHFSPESLQRFYASVHGALAPGGFFFNLDHVGAPGDWEQTYRRVRKEFTPQRRRRLKPHRHEYPLSRTDDHIRWATEAGFAAPDVPWRTLYTALVVARRPA